jgi:hypothetical protein
LIVFAPVIVNGDLIRPPGIEVQTNATSPLLVVKGNVVIGVTGGLEYTLLELSFPLSEQIAGVKPVVGQQLVALSSTETITGLFDKVVIIYGNPSNICPIINTTQTISGGLLLVTITGFVENQCGPTPAPTHGACSIDGTWESPSPDPKTDGSIYYKYSFGGGSVSNSFSSHKSSCNIANFFSFLVPKANGLFHRVVLLSYVLLASPDRILSVLKHQTVPISLSILHALISAPRIPVHLLVLLLVIIKRTTWRHGMGLHLHAK